MKVRREKMKKNKKNLIRHTPVQRFWGVFVFSALFVCGIMVGLGLGRKSVKLSIEQEQIINPVPQVDVKTKQTCQIIEDLLLERLYPEDSQNTIEHEENIVIYEKLLVSGCAENQGVYSDKIQREKDIVRALHEETGVTKQTCEQIEELLLNQLPQADGAAFRRIDRAKIYANLSERGCAQNSAKYVELAKQELEIARALEDDKFDEGETIEVVGTYKRLNMQAAAEEIFETAKKLTNPAIDFILEVEKIINQK